MCLKEQESATILAHRPEEDECVCVGGRVVWRLVAQGEIKTETLWLRASMKPRVRVAGEVLKLLPPGRSLSSTEARHPSLRPLFFRAKQADDESLPLFLSAGERMQGFYWFFQPALLLEFRPPVPAMGDRPEPPSAGKKLDSISSSEPADKI